MACIYKYVLGNFLVVICELLQPCTENRFHTWINMSRVDSQPYKDMSESDTYIVL